jgi:dihydroxy-acid dehydratase
MSGTAGGTIVLHISPESALPESPFGVVQTGDMITCDADNGKLNLEVSDEELKSRIEARKEEGSEVAKAWLDRTRRRGYRGLYERSVNQAQDGADFDFLTAGGPVDVSR